jgi:hypothetical protein
MAGVIEVGGVVARLSGSAQDIVLRPAVIEHMHRHRQTSWWKREAGGQLFARLADTVLDVVLATGPYGSDFRSRVGYRSAPASAQREILKQREYGLYYCGDWHTHPQQFPAASGDDFETIAKLQARSDLRLGAVLMVIVGTALDQRGLAVYVRTSEATVQWTTSAM